MHGRCGGNLLLHAVAERWQVDAFKQRLAAPEQDRRDGHVQFVEKSGAQILTDGSGAPPPDFHSKSGQGPRTGPNMFRPMIQALRFSKERAAKSSSTPVVPSSRFMTAR